MKIFMDEQSFLALQRECSDTLQEYVVGAEKTCDMLSMCKGEPLNFSDLRMAMAQRSKENEVHRRYMEVRERLFTAAQLGYRRGT
jgi:hypothetical protein